VAVSFDADPDEAGLNSMATKKPKQEDPVKRTGGEAAKSKGEASGGIAGNRCAAFRNENKSAVRIPG
jgi:hypothetical protein